MESAGDLFEKFFQLISDPEEPISEKMRFYAEQAFFSGMASALNAMHEEGDGDGFATAWKRYNSLGEQVDQYFVRHDSEVRAARRARAH